jgi:ABC-2 type transport system permease protein
VTRLLRAEAYRVVARPIIRLVIGLALLGAVVGGALAFLATSSLSERDYRQRVHAAESVRPDAQRCLPAGQGKPGVNDGDPALKACLERNDIKVHDPRFHRTRLRAVLQGSSGFLALVAWVVGASLIGAEYQSRSLTTTLTFEPRRLRLCAVKTIAAVGVVALLTAGALVVVTAAMLPALVWHGAPVRGEPSVASLAGIVLRGTALSAIAAALGFSIATIGRSTAAALGAGFAYIVILENIVGSTMEPWRRWLLLGNTIVFASGRNSGGGVPGRTVLSAGLFLASVAVTGIVAAHVFFRSRDVA